MSVANVPVNKQPTQLLRMLGISGPDAPNRLRDQIDGSLDLLPWILDSYANDQQFTTVPGAAVPGSIAMATVPASQIWCVTRFSLQSGALAAGQTYQYGGAQLVGSTGTTLYLVGPASAVQTGINAACGVECLVPGDYLLLRPGDQLHVYLYQIIGVPVFPTIRANVRLAIIPA